MTMTPATYRSNLEHIQAELSLLNDVLANEIRRWRRTHAPEAGESELMGLHVSDLGVDAALHGLTAESPAEDAPAGKTSTEKRRLHDETEHRSLEAGADLRLPKLAQRLGLDPFERSVVLLALAPELDPRYGRIFGYLNDDVERRRPSVEIALRLFCQNAEERHTRRAVFAEGPPLSDRPSAPLRSRRLLNLAGRNADVLPSQALVLEARAVEFLLAAPATVEPQLDGILEGFPQTGLDPLTLMTAATREAFVEACSVLANAPAGQAPIVFLHGTDELLLRAAAAALDRDRDLLVLNGTLLAKADDPGDLVARALREVELEGRPLLVENAAALCVDGHPSRTMRKLLDPDCSRPRFLTGEEPLPDMITKAPWIRLAIPAPGDQGRQELWRRALNGLEAGIDLAELAGRFRLKTAQVDGAVHRLRSMPQPAGEPISQAKIFAACRAQCLSDLGGLAQRIESVHGWDDLVLPANIKGQLQDIEKWLRYRHVVYQDWGYAQRVSVGRGMASMFSGSSGTGKTMAAGILANVLDLDLYRIDLSSIISKYIGETEKNLARIFDAAEAAHAILFFDEADSLFGKRSDVKDSHDRYANIEVSYLLQRMETYDGIAILATNIQENLDVAFKRRLQMVVTFPFPSISDRERIWRRMLPPEVPTGADVNVPFLAKQFNLSGGSIKNCVLSAALAAASAGEKIQMRFLIKAVARELEKMGKNVPSTTYGRYSQYAY